jgi:hypothetical protein
MRGIAVAIGDAERKDVAFASQCPDFFPIQQASRDRLWCMNPRVGLDAGWIDCGFVAKLHLRPFAV